MSRRYKRGHKHPRSNGGRVKKSIYKKTRTKSYVVLKKKKKGYRNGMDRVPPQRKKINLSGEGEESKGSWPYKKKVKKSKLFPHAESGGGLKKSGPTPPGERGLNQRGQGPRRQMERGWNLQAGRVRKRE